MCSLCFRIVTHILLLCLSERLAASTYNLVQHFHHFHFVLFLCLFHPALCQCNRTQAGLQNDRLACLVQSVLLNRFSVCLTFVKACRPTPAFPKSERDGFLHQDTSLFYHPLSGLSSFYIILLENKNNTAWLLLFFQHVGSYEDQIIMDRCKRNKI